MARSERCGRGSWWDAVKCAMFTALLVVGVVGRPVMAQGSRDLAGTWQGTLPVGKGQRIVVKIVKENAGWKGVVYNLDDVAAWIGLATTQMSLQGAELRFAIAPMEISYSGKLSEDGATIAGMWTHGEQPRSLNLVRAVGDAEWEIPRASPGMAKDADPGWEAATVKPSDPNNQKQGFHLEGRQIFIERKTVAAMLELAYGMHKKQFAGAPDWVETESWDVRGVPDTPGQPSIKQYQGMVRKLLEERFGLQIHKEKRELSVYAITVAKSGEKLVKSAGDPNGLMNEDDHSEAGQRTLKLTNASMAEFALVMQFYEDRPVVDQTGLAGKYDLRLKWTIDESRAPTDGTAAPSVFTAVQEQLGLKLEAVKAQTDVIVIDKVMRPSKN